MAAVTGLKGQITEAVVGIGSCGIAVVVMCGDETVQGVAGVREGNSPILTTFASTAYSAYQVCFFVCSPLIPQNLHLNDRRQ